MKNWGSPECTQTSLESSIKTKGPLLASSWCESTTSSSVEEEDEDEDKEEEVGEDSPAY